MQEFFIGKNYKGQIWNSDLWGCAWKALRQPSLTIETIWPDNGPYKSSLSMVSSTVKSRHTKQQPDNHRIYIRTVRPEIFYSSFGKSDSFLAGLGKSRVYCASVSVRLWNFKDGGSLKASFLAKNQHATKEKSLKNSYE